MKCQIAEEDAQNSQALLEDIETIIGRRKTNEIRLILENTDYDKSETRPEGYDYIWQACLRSVCLALGTEMFIEVSKIIDRCKNFQNLTKKEVSKLDEVGTLVNEASRERNECKRNFLLGKTFYILGVTDKAFEIIESALETEDIDPQFEFETRCELEDMYEFTNFSESKRICNLRNLIELCGDKVYLLERAILLDLQDTDVWDLIVEIIKKDANNKRIWKTITEEIFDITFYIYIAEKIDINAVNDRTFIQLLIYSYNEIQRFDDSLKLLERKRANPYHDTDFDFLLIETYIVLKKYNCALRELALMKSKEGNFDRATSLEGDIYRAQKHFNKAITCYTSVNPDNVRNIKSKLFLAYVGANFRNKAEDLVKTIFEEYSAIRALFQVYSWLRTDQIKPDELATYLHDREARASNRLIMHPEFEAFLLHVFAATKDLSENGVIRSYVLKLHCLIKRMKRLLMLEPSKHMSVYHYSSIKSLVHLADFKNQGAKRFRLSNVAYMNDPAEGNIISDILKCHCGVNDTREILEELYGDENTKYRKTFLSSFSLKPDFLPMWVQYSENGTGCCYKIPSMLFGRRELSTERQVVGNASKKTSGVEKSVLYQVNYYTTNENSIICNNSDEVIPILKQIGEVVATLRSCFIHRQVANMVAGMLDEIRYLFKSTDYSTESEVRIVETDFEDVAIVERLKEDRAPKLFLQLSFDLKFEELMLGPKAIGIKEWSAYLGKCTNVNKVTLSKILYN